MYDKSGGHDACWSWKGYKNEDGYGIVRGDLAFKLLPEIGVKKRKLAHRLAYQLHFGIDPGELRVAHHCDFPPCENPSHLIACTQKQNLLDGAARGRPIMAALGEANFNAKLSPELVNLIRSSALRCGDLANRFGVHPNTVRDVRRRRTWQHIIDTEQQELTNA
jgi:hypothetical protein